MFFHNGMFLLIVKLLAFFCKFFWDFFKTVRFFNITLESLTDFSLKFKIFVDFFQNSGIYNPGDLRTSQIKTERGGYYEVKLFYCMLFGSDQPLGFF